MSLLPSLNPISLSSVYTLKVLARELTTVKYAEKKVNLKNLEFEAGL